MAEQSGRAGGHAVGKGTIYNTLARLAFLLSSYVIHFSTAYLLASPQEYGTLGVVVSLITLGRVFFSLGLPQTASHYMASDESRAHAVWRAALKVQLIGSSGVMVLYLAGAWIWCAAVSDRALLRYIIASAPAIPLMAWYQMGLAYFNGRLLYGRQAAFVLLYSVLRGTLVVALVAAGFAVYGAVVGLVLSIGITAVCNHLAVPRGDLAKKKEDWRPLLSFSLPLVLVAIGTSVLLNLDILILKTFFPHGDSVGYYNGAMNLGKAPYFVFTAAQTTMLPAISQVLHTEGRDAARRLVTKAISFLLIVMLPIAVVVALTSTKLMDFVYPAEFVVGGPALSVLIVSMCGLTLLGLQSSALTSSGRPGLAMAVVVACLPVQVGLGWWLVPRYEMMGAATANLATVSLGLVGSTLAVRRLFGGVYDLRRLGKALVAALPVAAALYYFDQYPLLTLPFVYAAGCLAYFGLLVALRGIGEDELRAFLPRSLRKRAS